MKHWFYVDLLDDMHTFVLAATLGSFKAAGQAKGMDTRVAGAHVARLERHVGVTLIERRGRAKHTLTPVGQQYFANASPVFIGLQAAFDILKAMPGRHCARQC